MRLSKYLRHNACFCLLVVQDAFWSAESQQLIDQLSGAAVDKGLCVFEVLDEGPIQGVRANEDDVKLWVDEFWRDFPVVRGGPATASVLPVAYRYPSMTAVRVPSMRIALHRVGLQNKPIDDALGVCPSN